MIPGTWYVTFRLRVLPSRTKYQHSWCSNVKTTQRESRHARVSYIPHSSIHATHAILDHAAVLATQNHGNHVSGGRLVIYEQRVRYSLHTLAAAAVWYLVLLCTRYLVCYIPVHAVRGCMCRTCCIFANMNGNIGHVYVMLRASVANYIIDRIVFFGTAGY